MRLLPLGLALSLLATGCITLPEDPAASARDPVRRPGGAMTAEETRADETRLCTEGLSLTDDARFCATRTVTVEGTISGLIALDVSVETFNGNVDISPSRDGQWGFVATLHARGRTADDATARLDEIEFAWAHQDAAGHFLEILARQGRGEEDLSASVALELPAGLLLTLVAATSNGNVDADGLRTDGLALTTSNGAVTARADATQASLTTSNGPIKAHLRPTGDARWVLATSNGPVSLTVPEGDAYGYQLTGTTSNGEVEFTLRDGEKGRCPEGSPSYTPPCASRTFETHRFHARDHQVYGQLTTSNGAVSAGPG